MRKAILDKIRELEDWKSCSTGGYWREQLEFYEFIQRLVLKLN